MSAVRRCRSGLFGITGSLVLLVSPCGGDWPQWRGPLRTGAAADSPPLLDALPAEGLRPLWTSEPIKSARAGGWSSPIVVDGRVYLFAHEREQLQELGPPKYPYLPEEKRGGLTPQEYEEYERRRRAEELERSKAFAFREHVYCLDAVDGRTLWHSRSDSVYTRWPQSGSLSFVGGRLYLLGAGRQVRCVDAESGADVWTTPLPGDFVDEFYQASVLVSDGVAVTAAGSLFGLSAETGEILWHAAGVRTEGLHSSPVLWESPDGPRVLVHVPGGLTACVDLHSGRELWRSRTEGGHATPIVVQDRLITYGNSRQKGLRCFQLSDQGAAEVWKFHGAQDKGSSPVVVGDYVYVQGERRLACVALATGAPQWTAELDLASPQYTSLIAADGKVFYAYDGLTVFRATPEGFEPLIQARFNAEGLMAGEAQLRRLLRLDEIEREPNGQEKALRIFDREIGRQGPLKCATPAIAEGRLYVRTNSALVCYDLRAKAAPESSEGR